MTAIVKYVSSVYSERTRSYSRLSIRIGDRRQTTCFTYSDGSIIAARRSVLGYFTLTALITDARTCVVSDVVRLVSNVLQVFGGRFPPSLLHFSGRTLLSVRNPSQPRPPTVPIVFVPLSTTLSVRFNSDVSTRSSYLFLVKLSTDNAGSITTRYHSKWSIYRVIFGRS